MNQQRQVFKPYTGPPSHLHPNTYKGSLVSGGYLARNNRPSSDNAPSFKGRVYIVGCGWHWVAGWSMDRQQGRGPYLSLKFTPMSDEDAERYCGPKVQGIARPQDDQYSGSPGYRDDVPF